MITSSDPRAPKAEKKIREQGFLIVVANSLLMPADSLTCNSDFGALLSDSSCQSHFVMLKG